MSLQPRISIVTLGVADVARSAAFYERLGWRRSRTAGNADIVFFALDNLVLAVFSRVALAHESGLADGDAERFGGMTLAQNQPSEAHVDAALAAAVEAGARILKPAVKVFWGGYSGYFADPDGHPWEVAFNPFFPLTDAGQIELPA